MKNFLQTQKHELESWQYNPEKYQREKVRYPLLKKQMGLEALDTSKMEVWDIGSGPVGGVSSIINCRKVVRIDSLGEQYNQLYPQNNLICKKAEDIKSDLAIPDLVLITNALDHFDSPTQFLTDLKTFLKPGAYFAHLHAINNAVSHPHLAHAHNVNPEMFKEYLDEDFECVWYLDFYKDGLTYGWRKQPAFSGLYRKVTGYD